MPTKPTVQNLDATSAQVLNTIRAKASPEYRAAVPVAEANVDSVREIGRVIMDYQPFQNEFIHALVNRIGRVIMTSKMYDNPWAFFKKGMLEYGETIEEIFIRLADPHDFDPAVAEREVYKRAMPNVLAAFHTLNYKKFYKTTTSNAELKQAFLSWSGVTELISGIIDSMYSASQYDEFITMKYLLARVALNGGIAAKTVDSIAGIPPATFESRIKNNISIMKGVSNSLEFMSPNYNMAGVQSFARKGDQYLIMNAAYDAVVDVEVLASAFNMDKAEFLGHRVLVDGFGVQDVPRLNALLGANEGYTPLTADEVTKLDSIVAILVDKDFFMIFDNLFEIGEKHNPEGLYWNHWVHAWKTFSVSPFANAVMFTTEKNTLTGVTISPEEATVKPGGTLQLSAEGTGTGFVNNNVTWSVEGGSPNTYITSGGMLHVARDEAEGSVTVKATSVADPSISAELAVTISNG